MLLHGFLPSLLEGAAVTLAVALSSLADGAPRADVSLLMRNGTMAEPWYRFLARVGVPNSAVLPVDNRRLMTRPWYTYLSRL